MTDDKKKRGYGNLRPELREKYFKHLKKDKPPAASDLLEDDDGLITHGGYIEIDGERLEIEVDWSDEEEDDDDEETET